MKTLKQIWKKGVALLLAVTMSLSLLPVTVLAAKVENYVSASGLSYDKTTGKVTGNVVLDGGVSGTSVRVTIISNTVPTWANANKNTDLKNPAQGSVNNYKPGDSKATTTLPNIQFDTTIPANGIIPVDHVLAEFTRFQSEVANTAGRYVGATEFTYAVFVYDGQTNYDYTETALTIPLSSAAKLEANPNPIYLAKGEQSGATANTYVAKVQLTNTEAGTTANSISGTPDGTVVRMANGYPSTLAGGADPAELTLTINTATVASGKLTINYSDSSAGAQDPLVIDVIIMDAGGFTAAPIIITESRGTGTTGVNIGSLGATTAMGRIDGRSASNGFSLNSSAGWSNGSSGIYDLLKTNYDLRANDYADHLFADALNITNTDPSVLVEVTQAEIDAGTATPSGYVTVLYAQGRSSNINTDARKRILQVPIYYVPASTPDPINISFNANGKTTTSIPSNYQLTPSTAGGSVNVERPANAVAANSNFAGWATTSTGSVITSWPQRVSTDTTYYAQWTNSVTFNENYTGGKTTTKETNTSGVVTDWPATPTRTGWSFTGWYTDANNGTMVDSNNKFSTNTTLYAHWSQNTYGVTVNLKKDNGAYSGSGLSVWLESGGAYTQMSVNNSTGVATTSSDVIPGTYTIYVGKTASDRQVAGTVTVTDKASTADVNYYTVSFDLNGAPGTAPADQIVLSGKTTTYPAAPTWADHAFGGWGSSSTATSGGAAGTATPAITKTTTYWAVWTLTGWTAQVTANLDGTPVTDTSKVTGIDLQTNAGQSASGSFNSSTKKFDFTISAADAGKSYTKAVVKTASNTAGYTFNLATPISMGNKTATVDLYTVAVQVDNSNGASTAGNTATAAGRAEAYAQAGTSVTLAASNVTNWTFANWTGGTVANANSANTTITVPTAKTTLTAHFTPHAVLSFEEGNDTLTVETGYTGGTLDVTVKNTGPGVAGNVKYVISKSNSSYATPDTTTAFNSVTPDSGTLAANTGSADLTLNAVTGRPIGTHTVYIWAYDATDTTVTAVCKEVKLKVEKAGTPSAVDATFTWDTYLQQVQGKGTNNFTTTINLTNSFKDYKEYVVTFGGKTLTQGTDYTWTHTTGAATASFTLTNAFLKARTLADNRSVFKIQLTNQGDVTGTAEITMNMTDTMPSVTKVDLNQSSYTVGDTITVSKVTTDAGVGDTPAAGTVSYTWYRNGAEITGATGNTLDTSGFNKNDVIRVVVSGTAAAGTAKPTGNHLYKASSSADATVQLQAKIYTVTLTKSSMGTLTGNAGGNNQSTSSTADAVFRVTDGGSVAISAAAGKGYKFVKWAATLGSGVTATETENRLVNANSSSTTYGAVTGNASIAAEFKAVTDVSTSSANTTLNAQVGYTSPAHATITISNAGRKQASLEVSYSDPTGAFTFGPATAPTSIAGITSDANVTSQITVTPKAGLAAGTYTATVTIKETTDEGDTMSGGLKEVSIPVTFTVTGSNAKVKVQLDGTGCSNEVVILRQAGASPIVMTATGTGGIYTAEGLASGAYTIHVNGIATTATVSGAATLPTTPQTTVSFYTLALATNPAGLTAQPSASGGTKTTLTPDGKSAAEGYLSSAQGGAAVTVSAPGSNTDAAGKNYQFSSWTNTDAANSGAVTMNAAKTVTANYTATYGIKYHMNDGATTDPYVTVSGLSGNATLLPAPARTGYSFSGWYTAATGGSLAGLGGASVATTALGTLSGDGYYSLYARWTALTTTINFVTKTLPGGEYSKAYSAAIVATATDTVNSHAVTFTAIADIDGSGLALAADGTISGIPHKTGPLTFTATATANGVTKTQSYTIQVAPTKPTITGVTIAGATVGGAIGSTTVTASVNGPLWNGTQWLANGQTVKLNLTGTTTTPEAGKPAIGDLAATMTGNIDVTPKDVTVTYTPKATSTGVSGLTQTYADIYTETTFVTSVSAGEATYTFTVSPNPHDFGSKVVGAEANGVAAQDFQITRSGNQTLYMDYTLVTADGSTADSAASTYFTLTPVSASGRQAISNNTATKGFSVVPTTTAKTTPGFYKTYVRVSAYDQATGGNEKQYVIVPITFEVKNPANFEAEVQVRKTAATAGATAVGSNIGAVRLLDLTDGTTTLAPDASPANGVYKWTGSSNQPVFGHVYQVQVKYDASASAWDNAPGAVVSKDAAKDQVVDYYELTLDKDPSDISATLELNDSTAPLSVYLLEGQSAKADTTVVDGYAFNGWKDSSNNVLSAGISYNYVMGKAAMKLTASYTKNTDTYTVSYAGGSAPGSVLLPVDNTQYNAGAPVTVKTMQGVWPGHTFTGWSVTSGGVTITGNQFTMGNANVVLTAQWEKTEATGWSTLPSGTYGTEYRGQVAVTNAGALGVTGYALKEGSSLPGGLEWHEDGSITGKPYASAGSYTFTVVATNSDGTTWEKEYTLAIDKAQPVINSVKVTDGATVGGALTAATIEAVVTAPFWDSTAGGSTGGWTDRAVTLTWTNNTTTGSPKIGDLTPTLGSDNIFAASGKILSVNYGPGSTGTGITGQTYADIYKTAQFETVVSAGTATYDVNVDKSTLKFTVTKGKGDYSPASDTFAVTNQGNQIVDTKYTLDAGTYFDLDKTSASNLAAGTGTDTVTVTPKYNTAVGTYTSQVTVESFAAGDTTAKFTRTVTLILEVREETTFEPTVNVVETAVGGSEAPKTIGAVQLMPVGGTTPLAPDAVATAGTYTWTTNKPAYGTVYQVQVKYAAGDDWTTVPNMTVKAGDADPYKVEFFQILLDASPSGAAEYLKLNGTSVTAKTGGYFLKDTTVTAETKANGGYTFTKWSTDATTTFINHPVQAAATLTASFEEITEYTVTLHLNGGALTIGGTAAGDDPVSAENTAKMLTGGKNGFTTDAVIGVKVDGAGSYTITKTGYTFRGWALTSGKDGATGSFAFTANAANDTDDGAAADQVIHLYAVWTLDSTLSFTGAIIEGVYKHPITNALGGTASGGQEPYTYSGTLPFGLALDSGASSVSGTPDDTGTQTANVTVTDGKNDQVSAVYSVVIRKAEVAPAASLNALTVDPGADEAGTKANVIKALGKPQMDGVDTNETNVNGSWKVADDFTMPTTPGTYNVPVVFTPENTSGSATGQDKYGDHYNHYYGTVQVTLSAKKITGAGLDVTKPSTGAAPMTLDALKAAANTLTSGDSGANYTNDVEILGMTWTPREEDGKFHANTPYTVTVTLGIREGSSYRFDTSAGTFTGTIAGAAATVSSINEENVTLVLNFPAEDQVVDKIWVKTGIPAAGTSSTGVDVQRAIDRVKYEVAESSWYEKGTNTQVTSGNPFDASKTYDLVVKVKALPGYKFDATIFGKNANTELKTGSDWDACVNDSVTAPETPSNAKVETKLAQEDGRDVIYIRYSSFAPIAKTVVRIELVSGGLDKTVYYATTTPDQASGNTNIKAGVKDHKTGIDAVFSAANTAAHIKFKVYYTDSTGTITTDEMTYGSANSLVYLDSGNQYQTLADGYVFTNTNTPMDQATFDGQGIYLAYTKDSDTYYAPVPVGTLTVRELQASGITAGGKENVTLNYGLDDTKFKATTASITATVAFNSSAKDLSHSVPMTYNDTKSAGSGNWFFEVGGTGEATLALHGANWAEADSLTQLKPGDDVQTHDGKTVYVSYLDVNNNIVRTPVGVIHVGGRVNVSHVDVSFAGVPVYGAAIPAVPMGVTDTRETLPGEDGAGNFTATWYTDFNDATLTGTPATGTFDTKAYTVVVKVKPNTAGNYAYNNDTKFNFHFGADEMHDVTATVKEADGVYTMYYTFPAVELAKIAHVNVSVPQPVVYGTPEDGEVNQALGTNNSVRTGDVEMSGITWTDASGSTPTQFVADGVYTATFTLTTQNGYKYLNESGTPADQDQVTFIVSGLGPIEGGASDTTGNTVITSVTTEATDADHEYKVTVVYKPIKGGKVTLTDVVVDASVPKADVEKTGPEVTGNKPYALTTNTAENKWEYWNGSAWAAVSDGNGAKTVSGKLVFIPGTNYRVTARATLTDTNRYQITEDTKFYLAGLECTADDAADLHGTSDKKLTKINETTYALIQEFSIPSNDIEMITVTYPEPVAGQTPAAEPDTYGLQSQVTVAGTKWSTKTTNTAPTGTSDFAGTALTGNFTDGTYYMVEATIAAKDGYSFVTDNAGGVGNTQVNINGVLVNVGGAMGEKKDSENNTIGWAMAVYEGGNVKARYIAKTAAVDRIITEVTTNVTAPAAGATPASTTSTSSALNGEHRDVKGEGMTNGGDVAVTWTKVAGGNAGTAFEMATAYKATFTLTTQNQYTYKDSANNDERVLFSVNGVKVTGAGTATSSEGVTVQTVKNSDTSYTVTVTFPETSDKAPIAAVTVTYDEPVIGASPAKGINYTPAARVRLGTEADDNLLVSNKSAGTTWFKGGKDMTTIAGASKGMSSSDVFTPGEYTVYANFTAIGNFKFDANTTFTVNGHRYQGNDSNHVTIGTGGATAQVCHTFTVSGEIVHVAANVAQPVTGGSVSNAVAKLLAQTEEGMDVKDAGITVNNATWKVSSNGTDGWTAAGSTFEAGRYYQASFTVTANSASEYHFKSGDDVVEFLVNSVGWVEGGQSAEQSGVKVETAQNGGADSYNVTVTFPMTGATADVFTVWGKAEPMANSAISSAPLTALPGEPYQAVTGADTKWEHKTAAGAWEPATGSFLPGETYKASIKVEIRPENVGKYQFVNTTAGYINDTTPGATKVSYTAGTGSEANPQYVTIEREFTIEKTREIVRVGSPAPAKGVALPLNITAVGDNKDKYEFINAAWSGEVEDDGTAKAGTKYTLTVTVKPKDGVELYEDVTGYKWGSQDAATWKDNKDGMYTVTFTYTTPHDNYVSAAPAVGIVEPAKGVVRKDAVEITNVTVLETEWTEGTFDGDKFKSGETYTVKIYLADEKPDKQPLDAQVSLNGEKLNVQTDTDGRKYITKTWKTAEEDNKILSVHAKVTSPTAGQGVNSSMISVAGSEPYKIVDGTNKWYTDRDCTTEATGSFEAGKTYYAKLTVEMKPDSKQQFADNTTGYINQATPDTKTFNVTEKTMVQSFVVPKTTTPVTVNSTAPTPGNALPTNINPADSGKYTFESASWGPGTTAEYNTTYTLTVTVKPQDGVELPGTDTNGYTWNGKKASSAVPAGDGKYTVTFEYTTGREPTPSVSGGGTTVIETPVVTYALRDLGVTLDLTAEKVTKNRSPKAVPKVEGISGLKFIGWSETDPSTIKDGKLPTLVDPTTFKITDDKTFYAVYEKVAQAFDHSHYVIGFPNGTFGPDSQITRGQVATIIARACMENFMEGGAYGNPGNYTDVESHWAYSAISYCSMNGVFTGYGDGTFRPDQYITRQELATVVARLAGVQVNQGLPFTDNDDIAAWAVNGVYTNYANGWVRGYTDGTFKPLNDITRAETVRIFNGYLGRGTDREGLSELLEYVHSGVASNIEGDGKNEYMTWPDVPKTHWAYYEVIEAANDHNFHWRDAAKDVPPEDWDEAFIDETWRYQDDANDGADDVGRDNTLPVLTVTYVVQSNGVVWDSLTEQVTMYSSPDPNKMPQAVPSEGFYFAGWSETDPDTGVISLIDPTAHPVLEDKTFYAVFEPNVMPKVTVTYVIGDHGATDMALTEVIDMWQSPDPNKLPKITAHEGWRHIGWSETDPATGIITPTDPTDHPALTDVAFYALYEATDSTQPQDPAQTGEPTQPQEPDQTPEPPVASVRYSYINGYEDNTFHPDDVFTRATAAAIIANLKGYDPSASYDAPAFDDLEGHWAANAIAFCVSQGLMSGYTDNTFRPDNAITRQEFAVVLTRVAGETESGELPFADRDGIASYAADSVYTAYVRGWIGGYDDGTFLPERNVTRAEAVKMFNGYLGRTANREYIESQSGYTVFDDMDGHWAYYEVIEATNTWGL